MLNSRGENPPTDSLMSYIGQIAKDLSLTDNDVSSLRKRTVSEGFSFLTKTLPSLGKALDMAFSTGRFKLPSAFKKRWRGSEIPALCGSLFSSVFYRDGALRDDASSNSIRSIRMLCFSFYKYVLPVDDEMRTKTLTDFIAEDDSLCWALQPSEELSYARRLTARVFHGFCIESLDPCHGPGVVSNLDASYKNEVVPGPGKCVRHFGRAFFNHQAQYEFTNFHFWLAINVCLLPYWMFPNDVSAEVILVPKDSRGPRIISCEPFEHQFAQQGIRRWTQHRLETHPVSTGCVNFELQSVNRDLVLKHSIDRGFSTIDLKHASDRVSLALVRNLFSQSPKYLDALLACRSESTRIEIFPGVFHQQVLRKFAPMGSAVCFTTLSWVIYSLVYSALALRGLTRSEIKSSIFVYGDDLVIRTEYAGIATSVLEDHDLLINKEKSFINSHFLESCGMDAHKGVDVAPVRCKILSSVERCKNKRELYSTLADPKKAAMLVQHVALAGVCQSKGLFHLSEHLYATVEYQLNMRLPYGIAESSFLCRIVPTSEEAWRNNSSMGLEYNNWIGPTILACVKVSLSLDFAETGYGRIRRVLQQIGSGLPLPKFGERVKPRSYYLAVRKFNRVYSRAYGKV